MMQRHSSGFPATLLIGWMTLSVAGFLYAWAKGIPAWVALPVVTAILLEYLFYLVPGFEGVRTRLQKAWSPTHLAAWMACSALAPFLVYSPATGQFSWEGLMLLAALALALSFWYRILRQSPAADLGFIAVVIAVGMSRFMERIYLSPLPGVQTEVLGKLMLIRLGAMVMLMLRQVQGIGIGFLPSRRDWAIGVRHFLYFLPIGVPLASVLGLIHGAGHNFVPWKVISTFLGALWVLALSEEFLFRGLLQQWLENWTGRPRIALAATSLVFGLCHLPFRAFPNWRFALLAAIAGCFYGRAYDQARSIRGSMVTHALVVTSWRAFLE